MLLWSESFSFHTQVKFSSIFHQRIPAEAGVHIVCASPGIVHTNVVSSTPTLLSNFISLSVCHVFYFISEGENYEVFYLLIIMYSTLCLEKKMT